MHPIKWIIILGSIIWSLYIVIPLLATGYLHSPLSYKTSFSYDFKFNSTRAYDIIQKQVNLGPRYPGSEGIQKIRGLIASEILPTQKWVISYQNFSKNWIDGQEVKLVNIICNPIDRNTTEQSFFLMAHYDTRLWADEDPNPSKQEEHVLGANDGASGVAIVLELGRVLLEDYNVTNFQLIFFDGEDQGGIHGWDWLVGSRFYVESERFRSQNLSFAILFDMVAGKDATFKREKYSDQYVGKLVNQIWNEAANLGFSNYFLNQSGDHILDDHFPFIQKGFSAIDIIDDFVHRFKPWHTSFDNMTFIDTKTLEAVGYTLESVLIHLSASMEWLFSLSTFQFQTSIIFFDFLNGYLLITFETIYRKRRNSHKRIYQFFIEN